MTTKWLLFGLLLIAGLGGNNIVDGIEDQQQPGNFDRRNLQVNCLSLSRKICRRTAGCQWNGRDAGCGPVPTPPPSPEPVSFMWHYFIVAQS